ncbi:signal peptidase I [Candidatus Dojkabacteria bacterium]|nr:signal peptidase I [Candidatus Dojkabacteria bacterium]
MQFFIVILAVLVVCYLFLFLPNQVDGQSMMPNFVNGELLFTNSIGHKLSNTDLGKALDLKYKRGDVVIFQNPGLDPFIKRVIGLPGDEIEIKDGYVYVNSRKIKEDYIPSDVMTRSFDRGEGMVNIVPENRFFLMGDNRDNSQDSRFNIIGFVHRDYIKGKVFLRYTKCDAETEKCSFTFDLIRTGKIKYE